MTRFWRSVAALCALASVLAVEAVSPAAPASAASTVDVAGMTVTKVLDITGGGAPVGVEFAADGRIFVTIKEGQVLMYDGPGDTTPVTVLDIQSQVMSFHDRGMLGLALDPAFTSGRPYIYVLYTYDRDPFGANTTVPRWGDDCPSPPGGTTDGCTVSARLDKYSVNAAGAGTFITHVLDGADGTTGGWCNQFDSHSIGTVAFGADGALYVGAGDGASYNYADYGQSGGSAGSPTPPNPCNDKQGTTPHTGGRGTALTSATSRGGALRTQAVRGSVNGEYVSWNGAILRVNPDTGAAAAGNPLSNNGISGDDRIVAYGLRNPFRFNIKPGTNQIWMGDVGWDTYEELDTFTSGPTQTSVPNFGWPCYEGPGRQSEFDNLNTSLCESLYTNNMSSLGGVASPLVGPTYSWTRQGKPGQLPCAAGAVGGGGSGTGGHFVTNAQWPAALRGSFVFGDYARQCIAYIPVNSSGVADPANVKSLMSGVYPVSIENGPGGDIYYVDLNFETFVFTLNRIRPINGNIAPVASFTATPSSGPLPLNVAFDASGTTDANLGEVLTYTWDLDGDNACDDGNGVTINHTYTSAATINVKLCVSDQLGASDSKTVQIQPGNTAPVITAFATSADANGWKVGDTITFSANATDNSGTLAAGAYTWKLQQRHCESEVGTVCHTHLLTTPAAGKTGSFTASDHEYYAFLQLTLTVTDAGGLTTTQTKDIRPRVSTVTLQTSPRGVNVSNGGSSGASPLATKYLENGSVQLTVPATATVAGTVRTFVAWNDGNTSTTRTVNAAAGSSTYTAIYDALDETAPVVSDGSVTPARIDARFDGGVLVDAVVFDEGGATAVTARAAGPDATSYTATLTRQAGGDWAGTFHLPAEAPPGDYTVTVDAVDGAGHVGSSAIGAFTNVWTETMPPPPPPGPPNLPPAAGFTTIVPERLLDTREGTGAPLGATKANTVVRLQVTGAPGIDDDALGVVVNVTAVDPRADGFVTVFPCGAEVPLVSNLNMRVGETVANLAVVLLDDTGAICLLASQDTHLLADATAIVVPDGDGYDGISPVRVVDTREALGVSAKLTPGAIVTLPLGAAAIPADASGVVANVTVTAPDTAGYVTVFPCAAGAPLASNVNFIRRQTVSNLVLVDLDADQQLCATSNATLDLVVDVSGWLAPDLAGEPQLVAPYRSLDTRTDLRLTSGETIVLTAAELGVPDDATAIVANVTAVDTAAAGYVTVAPCEAGTPFVSNVNFAANDTRPVLTITAVDESRTVCIRTSQPLDLVVDIQGWFVSGLTPA